MSNESSNTPSSSAAGENDTGSSSTEAASQNDSRLSKVKTAADLLEVEAMIMLARAHMLRGEDSDFMERLLDVRSKISAVLMTLINADAPTTGYALATDQVGQSGMEDRRHE